MGFRFLKKKYKIKNKKAFTLFETVLALIIFSMLVGMIFRAYISIRKSEKSISNQQIIVSQTQDFLDRLSELSLDYTIDYEEYFNRAQISCISGSTALRNTGGACDIFTNYGNSSDNGGFYYCNSSGDFNQSGYTTYLFDFSSTGVPLGCTHSGRQKFGQYKRQFRDTVDQYLNNGNDVFVGRGPVAILQNTGVQELYLINNEGSQRVLFRRKFITGVDLNGDGFLTGKNESLYVIQMLRLKGLDAGNKHNFDMSSSNWGVYDGFIDTWACDYGMGFTCGGGTIPGYPNYELPKNEKDGRETITDPKLTISDWNFEIYPAKDPYLAKNESQYLIDPFVKITITANLYGIQTDDKITLQTSLGFKNSYSNFDKIDLSGVIVGTGISSLGFCGDGILQNPNGSGYNEKCDDGGYTGTNDGCSDTCDLLTGILKCDDDTLPLNAIPNIAVQVEKICVIATTTGCTLWTPTSGYEYHEASSTNYCYFKCDTGYNRNASLGTCDPIVPSTGDFVTVRQTDLTGSTSTSKYQIRIPTNPSYTYNYDVDCDNDLNWDVTGANGDVICTYANTGVYTVRIRGNFPAIYFNNTGDKEKILTVIQRGTGKWQTMFKSFYGCSNFGSGSMQWATDRPDLSLATSLERAFGNATSFNQDISSRDVSNITNMRFLFAFATSFNQDISSRDVSSVQDMQSMFWFASSFNKPLNSWNVSNVTNMRSLFAYATSFNQPLDNWNVSSVTSMYRTFGGSAFNQDISSRDVSNVTTMRWMFGNCPFNQPLNSRDVSSVQDMHYMFGGNTVFNQPLDNWNVSNVTDMSEMFSSAKSFDQDICNWNVSNVTDMSQMFQGASSFNHTIKCWEPQNVVTMQSMFQNATGFNQDFGNWETNSLVNMMYMFQGATSFDQNIGSWDISNVSNMTGLFNYTNLSTGKYDSILSGFYLQVHKTGVTLDAGNAKYCNAETARSGLIINDGWIIHDGGKDPTCP